MLQNAANAFRVVTWNCHRAKADSGVWDYLLEIDPDVALLQEVSAIPDKICSVYTCQMHKAARKDGSPQRFHTALLVRGRIQNKLPLPFSAKWVGDELQRFSGNLVASEILPDNGLPIKAISVYSPAWPVDRNRLNSIDVAGVRLTLNRDVWVSDLLWSSLQHLSADLDQPWIVAGDFNLSETFDSWPGGPRGNREYLDRMATLGFIECLRQSKGQLTPTFRNTFRNTRGGAFKHQIDHIFVSPALARRLVHCDTGSSARVFDANLSDHLPIVADFQM